MSKKIIAIITAFLCVFSFVTVSAEETESDIVIWDGSVAESFESGSGTFADPYVIKTPDQLAYLSEQVNGGTTYENTAFVLSDDIYLNDTSDIDSWNTTAPENKWTPIGNVSNSFHGMLDGMGHTVYGLYVDTDMYAGLFGNIFGSVQEYVQGVDFDSGLTQYGIVATLTVDESYVKATTVAGGVVGRNGGVISNCASYATVECGQMQAGGIAGYNNYTIQYCRNYGEISGREVIGGICGYSYGIITECDNFGTVSATSNKCAGIAADSYWIIDSCRNHAFISADSYAGGINGYSYGIITNCKNYGTVKTAGENCGGISGCSFFYVEACENYAKVTAGINAGGITGYSYGEVLSSNNFAEIKATVSNAGGIAGSNFYNVTYCVNKGDVASPTLVGGIVGYNAGPIFLSWNSGVASGNSTVGGIAGNNNLAITIGYCINVTPPVGSAATGDITGINLGVKKTSIYAPDFTENPECGTTARQILSAFTSTDNIRIADKNGNPADANAVISTDMKLEFYDADTVIYTAYFIIDGDTDGDGAVNVSDVQTAYTGLMKKCELSDAQSAAVMNYSDNTTGTFTILDILAMLNKICG